MGIGAVHHRAIARLELARSDELCDGIDDEGRLRVVVGRFIEEDLFSCTPITEKLFVFTVSGSVDDSCRDIQYVLMRAVVLLEQDRLRIGEVLFEAVDISVVSAAPGVNGLVGVAHAENISIK